MEPRDFLLDLADTLIVAWLFYRLLLVFRQTRAIRVLAGLGLLALVYALARFLRFEALLGLVDTVRGSRLEIGMVILAVIFADEIKDAFGGLFWRLGETRARQQDAEVIDAVSRAAGSMAARRCGALIAIAQDNPLDRWEIEDSVAMDAAVSAELIETIFEGKTPLHDGALVIRRGRLVAAKCQLPRSANPAVTRERVGMRHRAAFGLSEQSDAVVVVVSEERGAISVAHRGRLDGPIAPDALAARLRALIGVAEQPRPFWHPSRVFHHGVLKLVAFALASVLWADQTTTFTLRDEVVVFAPGTRQPRTISLQLREAVVVNEGVVLRRSATSGAGGAPAYTQALPPVEYSLTGPNRARLALLPRLFARWLRGQPIEPLFGSVGVELNQGGLAVLVRAADAFTIESDSMELRVDELAALSTDAIRIAFTGAPPADYTVLTASPVKPVLPDGTGNLVIPKAQKPGVEAALQPCPTRPPVAIDGRTEYAETVELLVPEVARRWNPEVSFRGRVLIEIVSERVRQQALADQLSDGQRAELEAQRADEAGRTLEARERFADLDRRLQDGTWEQVYRLEQYTTVRERIIPDLERRVEKTRLELEAVNRTIERLRADPGATPAEQELNRAGLTAKLKEQQARREILDALSIRLDLRRREQAATGERIEPLLEETRRAQQRAEEAARAEAPPPALDDERGLEALIDSDGPAGAARSEGARAIAREASARTAFALYDRALTGFERRLEAAREVTRLTREIEDLKLQLDKPSAPGTPGQLSPLRLDVALLEREARLEATRRTALREANLWKDLRNRLAQADAMLLKETVSLERVARAWPIEQVAALELLPLIELVRETWAELPQAVSAEAYVAEQLARMEARAKDQRWPTEVENELAADLARAQALLGGEPGGVAGLLEQVRRRLRVLAAIVARAAADRAADPPGAAGLAGLALFDADEAALAAEGEALAAARRRRPEIERGERRIALGDLDQVRAEKTALAEQLAQAQPAREAALAEIQRLDGRLAAALAASPVPDAAARALAVEAAVAKARHGYRHETIRRLQARRVALEGLETYLAPILDPVLARRQSAEAELKRLAESPQPERLAAQAYLDGRAADLVLLAEVEKDAAGLGQLRGGAETAAFAARLARVFRPLAEDDRGLDHLVAMLARAELSEETIRRLLAPLEGGAPEEPGLAAAARPALQELIEGLRRRELDIRRERLRLVRECIEALRAQLFDGNRLTTVVERIERDLGKEAATALLGGELTVVAGEIDRALAAREAQLGEARREAQGRTDPQEQRTYARRAQVLEERVARLVRLRGELGRVLAAAERVARQP